MNPDDLPQQRRRDWIVTGGAVAVAIVAVTFAAVLQPCIADFSFGQTCDRPVWAWTRLVGAILMTVAAALFLESKLA